MEAPLQWLQWLRPRLLRDPHSQLLLPHLTEAENSLRKRDSPKAIRELQVLFTLMPSGSQDRDVVRGMLLRLDGTYQVRAGQKGANTKPLDLLYAILVKSKTSDGLKDWEKEKKASGLGLEGTYTREKGVKAAAKVLMRLEKIASSQYIVSR